MKVLAARTLCALIGSATVAGAAVPGTVARFDTGEDGFVGSTIATIQVHSANGGNPDGHIQLRKDLTTGFDIGTRNSTWPEFLGDYAADGVTGAGFDLNVFNTTLSAAQLRFRRNVAENGWHYHFGPVLPDGNRWSSYDVLFNPSWNDATALARGWTREPNAPAFADLFRSVGWLEVRLINDGSAMVGIDNVRLVPEPAALGLLLAGATLLGRRR